MAYAPRYTNLVDLFDEATSKHKGAPLFGTRISSGWQWTSYTQFAELVAKARSGFAALGVGHGDRVAIISNNRLEWAVCAFAVYTRPAVYVPMYEAQLDRDWQYILHDSGAKVCLCAGEGIARRIRGLQGDLPDLQHVIDLDGDGYAALLRRGAEQPGGHRPC